MNGVSWDEIHKKALSADTVNKIQEFNAWIRSAADRQPCGSCKSHMKQHLTEYPPESAKNPFHWSIDFHNAVNKRTGKAAITYEEAAKLYFNKN